MDDIFERILSIKLEGHFEWQEDFRALRSDNSNSNPS